MSSYFDPNEKKNKPILEYFENKSWLIIDGATSTRGSIKKTLTQIGAQIGNMHDADNIADAENIILTKRPHFIITNQTVKGNNSLPLFELHLKTITNRNKGGFFVITEENSLSEVAWVLEYEMDGIIALPLNGTTIIQTILNGIKRKINPTPYVNKLEEGRAMYLNDQLDQAQTLFNASLELDERPYEGHSFLGQISQDKNLTIEAITAYEESVKHNPQYFKSLNKLGDLYYQEKNYKKSYDISLMIAKSFPISPEKIPELIRLSIINQKFEDIINYFKIFQTIKSPSTQMQNSLAAGMAILGKYFASCNDTDRAVEALRGAFKFSNGKYEILKSITLTFEELNKSEVIFELFEKADVSLWPKEVLGLQFHTLHLTCQDDQIVIREGEKLLKNNIQEPLLYRDMIERSIKMKRKIAYIENIVFEAQKNFPDLAKDFEALLKNI
jgi:tetratricopeptide (TPR) repeat protein